MGTCQIRHYLIFCAVIFLFSFASCSPSSTQSFQNALTQTGLLTKGQAGALFDFGGSVTDSIEGFTPEEEYYLGRAVAATVLSKYRPYNNQALTVYANRIAHVLTRVSDKPETFNGYRVLIVDTPEINAVSAPGGFIFISRGFIDVLPNEDALAGVIAHEIAHIVKSHGTSAISESNLTSAFLALGKKAAKSHTSSAGVTGQLVHAFGDSVSDITNTLLVKGFSRSQEYDADEYAVTLLTRAGYDPAGMHAALSSLVIAQNTGSSGGWMSTHPDPNSRMGRLTTGSPQSDEKGFKIRTTRFKKSVPSPAK
jgi:predicted Zn-dependent protease